ncbi:MAG: hypothetical protein FJ144_25950 [Deltaproteobacteria bacterium]|nr:hypothetical protein [Deltaproteobacteria bacterium]
MLLSLTRRCARFAAAASLLLLGAEAAAAASSAVPRLHERLSGATVVAVGRIGAVDSLDDDRVRVARIDVESVIKGNLPAGPIRVVELREAPSAPPSFVAGDRAVLFLRRLGRSSYFDETLGRGVFWEGTPKRYGVIASRDRGSIEEVATLVERIAKRSSAPLPTEEERRDERRAWLFDAVGAKHPAAVEEAAQALPDAEPPLAGTLTGTERERLARAIGRDDLPPRVRAVLIEAIGKAQLRELLPALRELRTEEARVLDAAWTAQAALGDAPSLAVLEPRLRSGDPRVRSAAVKKAVDTGSEEGTKLASALARTDPETDVRIAALEALGTAKTPPSTTPPDPDEAVEPFVTIEAAFREDSELVVRQAAGRVLFQRGGDEAAASLTRVAFAPSHAGQKQAVVLLLALERPADDPYLTRIRKSHPDPEIRELATHGIEVGHH